MMQINDSAKLGSSSSDLGSSSSVALLLTIDLATGLNELNKALKLNDDEEYREVIAKDVWSGNLEDTGHYLVDRLLTTKTVRFESLRDLLQSVINPIKGMELKAIENNIFLFRFNHSVDKNRALEGCPWSFEKNVLILKEVGENESPLTANLDWCSFYVHVHELPIQKMTKDFARYIGNYMGRFVDMEHMDHHRNWIHPCVYGSR
ncbi:UNVERIFIED_CONTAM: hypothetical protein Sangu_0987600 [Sesamum angustifolium]|uniref:DUF4283 domain-containing protein n=1 Tax=Sesamum angustifolium TaxID=2727405 RepID=A0AAW2PFS6_9LAMI